MSRLLALRPIVTAHTGLRLLILHGSRARGEARESSDWDFAYVGTSELDPALLYADLAIALGTDHIDLANLDAASGLLRYRAARDGQVVFESEPEEFQKFWLEAVSFWCDTEPVLRTAYKSILEGLDR